MSLLIEHKKKLTKKNVVKFAECEVFGEAQQLMSYSEMEKKIHNFNMFHDNYILIDSLKCRSFIHICLCHFH